MESLIWNTLNLWFKNNPFLLVIVIFVILFFWRILPWVWKRQTGKFKEDYDAKEHTRQSIKEIKEKVILINGSIQEHHKNDDCHFKKSEYLEIRKEDLERLNTQFESMGKVNLRALELLVKMNRKPRTAKNAT